MSPGHRPPQSSRERPVPLGPLLPDTRAACPPRQPLPTPNPAAHHRWPKRASLPAPITPGTAPAGSHQGNSRLNQPPSNPRRSRTTAAPPEKPPHQPQAGPGGKSTNVATPNPINSPQTPDHPHNRRKHTQPSTQNNPQREASNKTDPWGTVAADHHPTRPQQATVSLGPPKACPKPASTTPHRPTRKPVGPDQCNEG